jgi:hypothetical protein
MVAMQKYKKTAEEVIMYDQKSQLMLKKYGPKYIK